MNFAEHEEVGLVEAEVRSAIESAMMPEWVCVKGDSNDKLERSAWMERV